MHSHDRTLISSLGFADPDKKEPLHDLACSYLTEPDVIRSVFGKPKHRVGFDVDGLIDDEMEGGPFALDGRSEWKQSYNTKLEVPLLKGEGKYQTTIGFVDALLFRHELPTFDGKRQKLEYIAGKWTRVGKVKPFQGSTLVGAYNENDVGFWVIGVEVKIQPVPVGDLLRQFRLYQSHVGTGFSVAEVTEWVAVLYYDIDDSYVSTLTNAGIRAIRLGESFSTWRTKRKKTPAKLEQI